MVIPALDQVDRSLPTTVATYLRDEADLNGVSALELQQNLQQHPNAHGLPVFETFSRLAATVDGRNAIRYSDYVALADTVGIDVYPVLNSGDPASVGDVASAQRDLQQLAGQADVPVDRGDGAGDRPEPGADAAGDRGGGVDGDHERRPRDRLVDGRRHAVLGEPGCATGAPARRHGPRHVRARDRGGLTAYPRRPGVDAFATLRNGALTVFAVNPSPSAVVSEVFTLRGLDGRPVRVWGRGQTLASSGDSFTDTLPPLAWRIYVVAPI